MTEPYYGEPPGDLPTSYGRNKLVLLLVDPYLIHVYWDLDSTVPPVAGARPILRFHESGMNQTRPFDVDIDLTAASCYVNLWSSDKLYYADLGWRRDDGSFTPQARSNIIETPRGHSAAAALAPQAEEIVRAESLPVQQPLAIPFDLEPVPVAANLPPYPWAVPSLLVVCPPAQPTLITPPHDVDLTQLSEERFTPGISSTRDPLGD